MFQMDSKCLHSYQSSKQVYRKKPPSYVAKRTKIYELKKKFIVLEKVIGCRSKSFAR